MGTYGDLQSGKGGTYRKANEAESAAARDAKRRVKNTPDQLRALTKGILLSGADEVDARGAQLETMLGNVGKRLKGQEPEYTGRQAYDAVMKAQAEADKAYQNANPIESTALTAGGSLLMPGGGAVAKGVLGSGKGLLGSTALGARAFRGAMLGGLLGGVEGFAGGEQGKRVEGAKSGAAIGAGLGAALPVAGSVVGQVGKGAKRVANKIAGGTLTNPNVAAGERLAAALKADGLSPEQVRAAQNEWLKNGVTPQLMNLGGENTRRLLRAAANKGGAANTQAVKNVNQLAADLQGSVIDRTRQLTPGEARPAQQFAEDIVERRGNLASQQYKGAYETPIRVTPQVDDPLMGAPGRAALLRARKAAEARRDFPQMQQLDELLASMESGAPAEVSAGALDRARIAMGNAGRGALEDPRTRDIAGGMFSRADDIDAMLAQVPELQPARQTYRGMTGQERAVELGRNNAFTDPDAYQAELRKLMEMQTPVDNPFPVSGEDIRGAAGVGLRDDIIRNVGSPTEGATGYLNRLATGTNTGRVLEETFPSQAQPYREGVGQLVQQLNDARFVSPNNGSKTVSALEETGLLDALPPTSKTALVMRAFDMLRRGLTLTDQERAALMELGVGTDIERALQALPREASPVSQYGLTPLIAATPQ
ncbi:MAG: hypothetical protein JSS57_21480 [Proteobacteria bacterium]|nr:hypothetical protein [Pseudomonadota bacterium]